MVTRSTRSANRQQHLQQQPAPQPPPLGAVPVVPSALLAPMPIGGLLSGRASPSSSASAAAVGWVSIAPISVLDRLNDNSKAQSTSSGFFARYDSPLLILSLNALLLLLLNILLYY